MAGESQTPDWNWEQQESTMLGRVGPATEEVQSIEEQGIWYNKFFDWLYRHVWNKVTFEMHRFHR